MYKYCYAHNIKAVDFKTLYDNIKKSEETVSCVLQAMISADRYNKRCEIISYVNALKYYNLNCQEYTDACNKAFSTTPNYKN